MKEGERESSKRMVNQMRRLSLRKAVIVMLNLNVTRMKLLMRNIRSLMLRYPPSRNVERGKRSLIIPDFPPFGKRRMAYLVEMLVRRKRMVKKSVEKPVGTGTYLKRKNMMNLMTKAVNQVEIHPA